MEEERLKMKRLYYKTTYPYTRALFASTEDEEAKNSAWVEYLRDYADDKYNSTTKMQQKETESTFQHSGYLN